MKKFLLLGAAAMLACAANAQSLTKVWEMATPAGTGARYAAAYDGKIYLANQATGIVEEYANGAATGKTWDVNAFLVSENIIYEETTTDDAGVETTTTKNRKMWVAIAADQAGNLMVNTCTTAGSDCGDKWVLIKTDGTMEYFTFEYPGKSVTGRIDGGIRVIGNLTEDAFVFLTPSASPRVAVVYLYADPETNKMDYVLETSYDIASSGTLSTSCNVATTADYEFLAEFPSASEVSETVYMRIRNDQIYAWDATAQSLEKYGAAADTHLGTGFDIFEIDGTKYYVAPLKNGGGEYGRNASFQICKLEDHTQVAQYTTGTDVDGANMTLLAEVADDGKTATIYEYHQNEQMGVYKFDPQGESGVAETLVDANAPVEYYNLQGVKVANPENGIFVKKQGGKATKVVL